MVAVLLTLHRMSQGAIPRRAEEMRAAVLMAVERLPVRNSAEAARPAMTEEVTMDRPRMERRTEVLRHLPQTRPAVRARQILLAEETKEVHPAETAHLLRQQRIKRSPQALEPPQEAQDQQRERRLPVPLEARLVVQLDLLPAMPRVHPSVILRAVLMRAQALEEQAMQVHHHRHQHRAHQRHLLQRHQPTRQAETIARLWLRQVLAVLEAHQRKLPLLRRLLHLLEVLHRQTEHRHSPLEMVNRKRIRSRSKTIQHSLRFQALCSSKILSQAKRGRTAP